jgi:hypothetical protein
VYFNTSQVGRRSLTPETAVSAFGTSGTSLWLGEDAGTPHYFRGSAPVGTAIRVSTLTAATILSLSTRTLDKWRSLGRRSDLPFLKLGNKHFVYAIRVPTGRTTPSASSGRPRLECHLRSVGTLLTGLCTPAIPPLLQLAPASPASLRFAALAQMAGRGSLAGRMPRKSIKDLGLWYNTPMLCSRGRGIVPYYSNRRSSHV